MDYTRQTRLFDPERYGSIPIHMVGVGAIGSIACLMLAKVGFNNITCYDHDKIEEHNLPNQFYPLDSVGHYKVEVLQKIVLDYTGVEISAHPVKWEKQKLEGIIISSVDSMTVRKQMFDTMQMNPDIKYMIDPRMAGLDFRVACVNFDNANKYSWYPDSEASSEMCGARSIMFNVGIVGGIVANMACMIAQGRIPPSEIVGDLETICFTTIA